MYFRASLFILLAFILNSIQAAAQADSVKHFNISKVDTMHRVTIARRSKGTIKARTIIDAGQLDMLDCSSCTIKSFRLVFYYKYYGDMDTLGPPGPFISNSNMLTPDMKKVILRSGRDNGTYSVVLTFTDIEYEDYNKEINKAPDLKLTILTTP